MQDKAKTNLSLPQGAYKLVAVTKGRSVNEIIDAYKQFQFSDIAENRVTEAKTKFSELNLKVKKHFIGNIQSRKISEITALFDVVQSISNVNHANKLDQCAQKLGKTLEVMIQVNISGQAGRSGSSYNDFSEIKKVILELPNLKLIGVMGIASQDPECAREEFYRLKQLQGNLEHCSMGMSGDYKIALSEGSTMLRLGRVLFIK